MKWCDYCTPRQKQIVEVVDKLGVRGAAKKLGIDRSTVDAALDGAELLAARAGYAPSHDSTHTAPPGYHVKGTSTLYGEDGVPKLQWVKTQANAFEREILIEAARELATEATPLPRVTAPTNLNEDLTVIYPIGDPHWGMFSWPEETQGPAWDLKIAEATFQQYIDQIVEASPPAKHALCIDLGDAFHTDNSTNRTNASGAQLDVDTRWAQVFKVGTRIMHRLIERLLSKHETIRVWCIRGNHDDHSGFMLACVLEALYANNPRVIVNTEWNTFKYHEFGRCYFMATHGHTCKREQLPLIMATHDPAAWGRTIHRKAYSGHIHHESVKEFPGMVSESYNTLAPGDAWHSASGYRSKRDLKSETWHRTQGLIATSVARVLPLPEIGTA